MLKRVNASGSGITLSGAWLRPGTEKFSIDRPNVEPKSMNSIARGSCGRHLNTSDGMPRNSPNTSRTRTATPVHCHRPASTGRAVTRRVQRLAVAFDVEGHDLAGEEAIVPRNQRAAVGDRDAVDPQHAIADAEVGVGGGAVRPHRPHEDGCAALGPAQHGAAATDLHAERRLGARPHQCHHDPEGHRRQGEEHERGEQAAMTQHRRGDRVVRHLRRHLDRGGHARNCTGDREMVLFPGRSRARYRI